MIHYTLLPWFKPVFAHVKLVARVTSRGTRDLVKSHEHVITAMANPLQQIIFQC